jgi:Fe-S cluster assembly ATP-binding protein
MSELLIEIKDLECNIDNQKILQGLNLKINKGEVHAIMGPNGSGKSTLSSVLAGNDNYEVTNGSINFLGE